MSRFFATGSDSESDTSSEEEQVIRQPTANFTVRNFQIVHQEHTLKGGRGFLGIPLQYIINFFDKNIFFFFCE